MAMLGATALAAARAGNANAGAKPNKPSGQLKATTEQLIDAATLAQHKTGTLLLLHINDVHDILKAPKQGLGGLAYVAGYANQTRAQRPDTIFLDAGDILQKGDKMGVVSQGEASYRVLGAIGLDATVPGNHDFFYGFNKFLANVKLVNLPIICGGMIYEDTQEPVLAQTMIKQIGGVKVGLIGATISRPIRNSRAVRLLPPPEMAKRINELALGLEPQVDLTILILHNGTWASRSMAKAAPSIDIVICGHTNEVTEEPDKAETGALVLTVGRAGQWVGTLDMVIDRDLKKIGKYTYQMVAMDHKKVQPEAKVAKLIDDLDKKWSPAVSPAASR